MRDEGFYWVSNPDIGPDPEVAHWNGNSWSFTAVYYSYSEPAVTVLSDRLVPPTADSGKEEAGG
jgi:hypothetical protein